MKLQKKLVKLKEASRGISRIPTTSGTEIFPTLVHGRKPLNNVTKGAITDAVRGPRNLWNIINKTQISLKRITENIV